MGDELFDQNGVNEAVTEITANAVDTAADNAGEAMMQVDGEAAAPAYETASASAAPAYAPVNTDPGNILSAGADVLREIKNKILRLDELKVRVSDLKDKQTQLEKDIAAKQKAMDTEINTVLSKRRAEVEKSFDANIEQTREQVKNVKTKRDKYKGTKVDERVVTETADLNEQVRSLKQDIRGIFSREHISRLFNNGYFFTMFMPDGLGDFLIILLSVIVLLAIPAGVYMLLPESLHKVIILVGIYAVVIVIALLVFTLIFKTVKEKHADALKQARLIREKIKRIKKHIARTEKVIRKDKDESGYGLEKYDEELNGLGTQLDDIISSKKQALAEFESTTKKNITDEIKARYAEELNTMKTENEAAYNEQRDAETQIKSLSIEISGKYESYLGKEALAIPMLDSLTDIIDKGNAHNIAEAIAYYKNSIGGV